MRVNVNCGNKMKTKKAQIKVNQMAFMLIALTLLFVVAGLFFLVIRFAGIKDVATSLQEKNAMLLVTKLANSPEFSCGEVYGTGATNCIDGDKVIALKKNIANYRGFWGNGVYNIEIKKIYPEEPTKLCEFGNYPECNTIRLLEGEVKGFSVENFVSLCRKESESGGIYNKCEIAKLMISYENVE